MSWKVIAIAAVLALGAGCPPQNLSKECQDMISECLGDCRDQPAPAREGGYDRQPTEGRDMRSDCERRCTGICSE